MYIQYIVFVFFSLLSTLVAWLSSCHPFPSSDDSGLVRTGYKSKLGWFLLNLLYRSALDSLSFCYLLPSCSRGHLTFFTLFLTQQDLMSTDDMGFYWR